MAGPERPKLASLQPSVGFPAGGSPLALPSMPDITPPEYFFPGPERYIVACTLQLHPGVGTLAVRDIRYPGSVEIFAGPLLSADVPTSVPNVMSRELPLETPRIPTHTSRNRLLQPGGHQIPESEGSVAATPAIFTPSSPTVDVRGAAVVG